MKYFLSVVAVIASLIGIHPSADAVEPLLTAAYSSAGKTVPSVIIRTENTVTPPHLTLNPVTTPLKVPTVEVSGTAEEGATVTLALNSDASQPVAKSGTNWSHVLTDLPPGQNVLTVTATDADGINSKVLTAYFIYDSPRLVVSLAGTGGGFVNSDSAEITCPSGSCWKLVDYGSTVTLFATPDSESTFSSWSGACTGAGDCTLDMNGDKSVVATFNYVQPVRTTGATQRWFGRVADAYATVASGGVIQMREFRFPENLVLNRPISVLLQGGYDAAFSGNDSVSTIAGSLTVKQGSVSVDRVVVGPKPRPGILTGTVRFWRGNFMPGSSWGTKTPVVREIFIYEVTTVGPDDAGGSFFSSVPTRLVKTTWSNSLGNYRVALPPGQYSVFVKEGSILYSNGRDTLGRVNPVSIVEDGVTTLPIDITYAAAF